LLIINFADIFLLVFACKLVNSGFFIVAYCYTLKSFYAIPAVCAAILVYFTILWWFTAILDQEKSF